MRTRRRARVSLVRDAVILASPRLGRLTLDGCLDETNARPAGRPAVRRPRLRNSSLSLDQTLNLARSEARSDSVVACGAVMLATLNRRILAVVASLLGSPLSPIKGAIQRGCPPRTRVFPRGGMTFDLDSLGDGDSQPVGSTATKQPPTRWTLSSRSRTTCWRSKRLCRCVPCDAMRDSHSFVRGLSFAVGGRWGMGDGKDG